MTAELAQQLDLETVSGNATLLICLMFKDPQDCLEMCSFFQFN